MEMNGKYLNNVYLSHLRMKETIDTKGYPDYEYFLELIYTKLLKEGDTVIDIGAHTGRHLKVFLELVGDEGGILAFEPTKKPYNILMERFNKANINVYNCALSNTIGDAIFNEVINYPEESGLKVREYNNKDAIVQEITVRVDILDNYFDEIQNLKFIKIDTEGAELNILSGGMKVINEFRPYISVEYGKPSYAAYGLKRESMYNFAKDNNYYLTDIFGNLIVDLEAWNYVCDTIYWDYILVPKEKYRDFCESF